MSFGIVLVSFALTGLAAAQSVQTGTSGNASPGASSDNTLNGAGATTSTGTLPTEKSENSASNSAAGQTTPTTSTGGSMSDVGTTGTMNGGGSTNSSK